MVAKTHLRGYHPSLLDKFSDLFIKRLELGDEEHQDEEVAVGDADDARKQGQLDP